MQAKLSDEQWAEFENRGYVNLGRLPPDKLRLLQAEIDDIMLGKAKVDYDKLMMQLEGSNTGYHNLGGQTLGSKGSTLNYRKIQNLEIDPVFKEFLDQPIFQDICRRTYGTEVPVALFRAMFFNKPARTGSVLPWHQDRWNDLDTDPLITIWTSMDPSTKANGCLQIIPGSHRHGLINPTNPSGFLNKAQSALICTAERVVHLELEPGEVLLLHNYLLHASEGNTTAQSRRAFSVCYMKSTTKKDGQPVHWPLAFS